ncbi:MAG: hypothetical protein HYX78_01200 [Armatimonadetes bacterium]|nr:hypothetical protein [Armatimonadota bacterium]
MSSSILQDFAIFDGAEFFREMGQFYSAYPADVSDVEEEWRRRVRSGPGLSSFRCKALLYEVAAERCDVHLFRQSPFYYEIVTGRPRNSHGMDGLGALVLGLHTDEIEHVRSSIDCFEQERLFSSWEQLIDWDHHSVGYDNVLACGLGGLRETASERLERSSGETEQEFLASVVTALDSLMSLSSRFADRAEEMLDTEDDPAVRARLLRIAETARRVPAEPARTFYEALSGILFMREACASLDGIGVCILGHLDRMLEPYYRSDINAGRLTEAEAKSLLQAFLAATDARFDLSTGPETATTVNIGGQDRSGRPVYNEVTRIICEVFLEMRLVNPKVNARICAAHPDEYYNLLARAALSGCNVLAIFNDETIIRAHAERGKAVEDCRLYVSGGCQELMLQNTEVNFRGCIYLNLLKVLELTIHPERSTEADREHFILDDTGPACGSFEAFYESFLNNLKSVLNGVSSMGADAGSHAWRINPCPMTSATVSGCIENGRDMMQGGAKYNSSSISLNGFGTLVDSLYSIKELVYDRRAFSMDELKRILDENYRGHEGVRRRILREIPKYGQDQDDVNAFARRLAADIARLASGQDNGRGGKFEASLFSYGLFHKWGEVSPATPDGRLAGEPLSRGMGPSGYGTINGVTAVINSACSIPMDKYPGGGVLDISLPIGMNKRFDIAAALIRRFIEGGGSILQMNVMDNETLKKARANPLEYPWLVVRVYGFSARYVSLPADVQDEILSRTQSGGQI